VLAVLDAAGFAHAAVTTHVVTARFPSVRDFAACQVAASPLAEPVARLTPATRQAMIADLEAALSAHVDD
jgi:hypothetical protein